MGWVRDAIAELSEGRAVQVQAFGGSMRGRIESGQLVTLHPANQEALRVDDIVLVRWRGNYLLHRIEAIDGDRLLIGNTLGKINGWAARTDVIGCVTDVLDEPTATATVICHESNLAFRVQMDSGPEVVANVPKAIARDMYRIVPGDRVVVAGLWNATHQIRAFADDLAEQSHSSGQAAGPDSNAESSPPTR